MSSGKERISLELESGEILLIEVQIPPEEGMVERSDLLRKINFSDISKTIQACGKGLATTFNNFAEDVKPDKASIEFGVEVGVESGELASYIVNASGRATFKVTLEWEPKSQ